MSVRLAAVAALSTVAIAGGIAPALAGAAPAQTSSSTDCIGDLVDRAVAAAATLSPADRAAYIRREADAARARCRAAVSSALTTTTSPSTTTSTSTTTTTTSTSSSTTTTSPTTTTTSTSTAPYEVTVTGVIGSGSQTLTANCRTGDRLVSYRYVVGSPTGSNTSRNVNISSNGRGVTLTYQVTGPVADPRTSLTVVCKPAT